MAFDPVTAILDIGGKVLDKFFPDANKAQEAKLELAKMLTQGQFANDLAQIQLNIEEAKVGQNLKTDWMEFFIAGWRPAIGWVGGSALAYNSIVLPMSEFVSKVVFHYGGVFPEVNTILLGEVLLGLLGMGALRSMDKKNAVGN